ncbi:MAG: dockerin type I domain-containing protein [Phycisphaerales bacterium]|nr:dockerin type I domain-containing protein [Phycisphaerales bacterium]
MSTRSFHIHAAVGFALCIWSTAQARPSLQATVNTTDPFLIENGLKSAILFIDGFADGQSIQGFVGTASNPWNVTTTSSEGFFNIDSVVDPNDPKSFLFEDGYYAAPSNATLNALTGGAARWDSGLLGNPATFGSPYDSDPDDDVGGFALFADGSSDVSIDPVGWISLQPNGVPVNANTQLNVMRVTWPACASLTVSFMLEMNTPPGNVPVSLSIPYVPDALGACCLDDGTCVELDSANCICSGGTFQGVLQPCGAVACPQPCPADLTGDGQVNVADLLAMIAAWGPSGGPADLNGDGFVNVLDLLALISAWGACA